MKILFVNGIRAGEVLDFAIDTITVGRESDNHLRLPAGGVSRYHGRFVRIGKSLWQVSDTGSTNGILLNGVRIKQFAILNEGDKVAFGDQILQVSEFGDAAGKIEFSPFEPEDSGVPEAAAGKNMPVDGMEKAEEKSMDSPSGGRIPLDVLKTIRQSGENIFAKSGAVRKAGANGASSSGSADGASGGKRSLFSSKLYYVMVFCVLVMGFAVFRIVSREPEAGRDGGVSMTDLPMVLIYEKQEISDDNIFRFLLELENGMVRFTVDDLKSQRKVCREFKDVDPVRLKDLKVALENAGIMQSESPQVGSRVNNQMKTAKIMLIMDGKNNEVCVQNNTTSRFDDAQAALESFAGEFGMQTRSMSRAELEEAAQEYYDNAVDRLENRDANDANLREAISYFKKVLDYLGEFSPKPELWKKAGVKLAEAERYRMQKLYVWNTEYSSAFNQRDWGRLKQLLQRKMEMFEIDSREYRDARYKLSRLQTMERGSKKR